jgi:hypothetical protein
MTRFISRRDSLRSMLLGGAAFAVMGRARIARAATSPYRLTLYRDPHCACCLDWVAVVEKTFVVEMVTSRPLAEVNKQLDIPYDLWACHTGVVDKYIIEGHVPPADIERLLRERPDEVRGLSVPGMPMGAPGMESPDGQVEPFTVFAFRKDGELRTWARYSGA